MLIRLLEEWRQYLDNNKVVGGVLWTYQMRTTQSVNSKTGSILYICSYLSSRKQCVGTNEVHSSFQSVISGVTQGSNVGHTLFNRFFSDFFYFIDKASVHNFAGDNSLSAFKSIIKNLKLILESESKKNFFMALV